MISFKNIKIDEQTGKLVSMAFKDREYLSPSNLWRVSLTDGNEKKSMDLDDGFSFSSRITKNFLVLTWENDNLKTVVNVLSEEEKLRWNIVVASKKTDYKISSVAFPIINGIETIKTTDDDDVLLVPYQGGWLIHDPVKEFLKNSNDDVPFWLGRGGNKYEGEYPASLNYQFTSYSSSGIGCYIGTDDPEAYIKTFRYYDANGSFAFEMENYPENAGGTTSYSVPYDFIVRFYEGDWQRSVEIYREWAIEQKWCRKPLIEKGIKENVLKTDLWRINHQNYALGTRTEEYFETSKMIRDRADANLALHWYGWNLGAHDVDYPKYISDEVKATGWEKKLENWNKRFTEEGIVKIPYVNARLWDNIHKSFKEENVLASAIRMENGELPDEPWNGGRLNSVCPATALWQTTVTDFCDDYVNNLSFDGLYIDQVASFNATPCYVKEHPHPSGGGTWWNNSYHHMLRKVRGRVGDDKILTSESCCETYIDMFDIFLVLDNDIDFNGMFLSFLKKTYAEPTPIFSMIYGKHALQYGSICKASDRTDTFEYKFIKNILWGAMPTIEGFAMDQITDKNADEHFRVIKEGVGFFKANKEKMLFGRVCAVPEIECENIASRFDESPVENEVFPIVIGVVWENPDNSKDYLLYNTSDKVENIKVNGKAISVEPKKIISISI